jgi:ATP-dependent DNA ligase
LLVGVYEKKKTHPCRECEGRFCAANSGRNLPGNAAGSHRKLVCQVAFVEWTDAGHLRHCTFVAMRNDKKAAEVIRET